MLIVLILQIRNLLSTFTICIYLNTIPLNKICNLNFFKYNRKSFEQIHLRKTNVEIVDDSSRFVLHNNKKNYYFIYRLEFGREHNVSRISDPSVFVSFA